VIQRFRFGINLLKINEFIEKLNPPFYQFFSVVELLLVTVVF